MLILAFTSNCTLLLSFISSVVFYSLKFLLRFYFAFSYVHDSLQCCHLDKIHNQLEYKSPERLVRDILVQANRERHSPLHNSQTQGKGCSELSISIYYFLLFDCVYSVTIFLLWPPYFACHTFSESPTDLKTRRNHLFLMLNF